MIDSIKKLRKIEDLVEATRHFVDMAEKSRNCSKNNWGGHIVNRDVDYAYVRCTKCGCYSINFGVDLVWIHESMINKIETKFSLKQYCRL